MVGGHCKLRAPGADKCELKTMVPEDLVLSWDADNFREPKGRPMIHLYQIPAAFHHQLSDLR